MDGPRGTPRFSRFGCVEVIRDCARGDFVIVFDDSDRPGEKQTIEFVENLLAQKEITCERRDFGGRTQHAVLAAGRFRHVLYYWRGEESRALDRVGAQLSEATRKPFPQRVCREVGRTRYALQRPRFL